VLGVTELAERTGLHKATVHRLLPQTANDLARTLADSTDCLPRSVF
jgi:DNA-binding IclR family transcriptional regulator